MSITILPWLREAMLLVSLIALSFCAGWWLRARRDRRAWRQLRADFYIKPKARP